MDVAKCIGIFRYFYVRKRLRASLTPKISPSFFSKFNRSPASLFPPALYLCRVADTPTAVLGFSRVSKEEGRFAQNCVFAHVRRFRRKSGSCNMPLHFYVPCSWNRICHWSPYLLLIKGDEVTAVTARFLWENFPRILAKLVI